MDALQTRQTHTLTHTLTSGSRGEDVQGGGFERSAGA